MSLLHSTPVQHSTLLAAINPLKGMSMDLTLDSVQESFWAFLRQQLLPGLPMLSITVSLPLPLMLPQGWRSVDVPERRALPLMASLQLSLGCASAVSQDLAMPRTPMRDVAAARLSLNAPMARGGGTDAMTRLHALVRAARAGTRRELVRMLRVPGRFAEAANGTGQARRHARPPVVMRAGVAHGSGAKQPWGRPVRRPVGGYPGLLLLRSGRLAGRCRSLLSALAAR